MLTDECSLLYRRNLTGPTQLCKAQPQECPGACCGKNKYTNCPPRKPKDASAQGTPRSSAGSAGTGTGSCSAAQPTGPEASGPISRGASSLKDAPQDRSAILSEMQQMMKSICNCQNDLPERLQITSLPPDYKSVQYTKETCGTYTISQMGQPLLPALPGSTPAEGDQPTCTATSCKIAQEISEIEENLKLLRRELLRTRKEQEWLREQKRLLDCVKPQPTPKPCPGIPKICVPSKYGTPKVVACVNTIKPTWTLPKCEGKKL